MKRAAQLFAVVALVALTIGVYAQVRHFDFLELDDPAYVTENPNVTGGLTASSIGWAFTTGHAANWHPLTWLSHMLDVQLFGVAAGPHHLMNVALHVASSVLLLLLLVRITGAFWPSAFVAALFALHPLHVESVAWVAERKDVLSTLLAMLTLLAYVSYAVRKADLSARSASAKAESPKVRKSDYRTLGLSDSRTMYVLVIVLFALGLMAKPMLVTLPFVMLLLDVWPLGRMTLVRKSESPIDGAEVKARRQKVRKSETTWMHLVREKIPLFLLAAASSVATVVAQQRGGAVVALQNAPLSIRAENAIVSSVAYLRSAFWPTDLTMFYSFPESIPDWQVLGALMVLAGVSLFALLRARRQPYLLVGWLWYLGTLVPVLGIVQVGLQARADRYTYVPLIGIFIMIAWGVPELLAKWQPLRRVAVPVAAICVIAAFTMTTYAQVGYWKNNVTLFTHAAMVDLGQDEFTAHMSLGTTLVGQGRLDEAAAHFTAAVQLQPRSAEAHQDLGATLARSGRMADALREFGEAVRLDPSNETARRAMEQLKNR